MNNHSILLLVFSFPYHQFCYTGGFISFSSSVPLSALKLFDYLYLFSILYWFDVEIGLCCST
jgi:hypothetical protein